MFGVQYPGMAGQQMPGGYMDPYTARLAALQQPQMQPAQSYDIITVHGEPGARAFRMAPNSRCLLLDDTEPLLWLAQTDGAGYPTLTPYDISPHQAAPAAAPASTDLAQRVEKLEAFIYGKPNPATAQPATAQQPAGGPVSAEHPGGYDSTAGTVSANHGRA